MSSHELASDPPTGIRALSWLGNARRSHSTELSERSATSTQTITGPSWSCFTTVVTVSTSDGPSRDGITTVTGCRPSLERLTRWRACGPTAKEFWQGSCASQGGNPSTDGIIVFANNDVCTITFPP